jgi:NADH:ubiquinone oxidoreductase subunit
MSEQSHRSHEAVIAHPRDVCMTVPSQEPHSDVRHVVAAAPCDEPVAQRAWDSDDDRSRPCTGTYTSAATRPKPSSTADTPTSVENSMILEAVPVTVREHC